MHKHRRTQTGGGFEYRKQFSLIKIPVVDMAAYLDPGEAQFIHTALQLSYGQIWRLQRYSAEPDEVPRMLAISLLFWLLVVVLILIVI